MVSAVYGTYWKRRKASLTFGGMAIEKVTISSYITATQLDDNKVGIEPYKFSWIILCTGGMAKYGG